MARGRLACLILLGLLVSTGARSDTPDEFAIYLLADPTISVLDARDTPLQDLQLEARPWLSGADVVAYDFSSHVMYLSGPKEGLFDERVLHAGDGHLLRTRPFVVVAGGERIFLGAFHSLVSSLAPILPHFTEPIGLEATDVLRLQPAWVVPDIRSDPRVEAALDRAGLLLPGVSIDLMSVRVVANDADGAIVETTFVARNEGEAALYLPDPAKMGDAFHYYCNGLQLRQVEDPSIRVGRPRPASSVPNKGWFTRVPGRTSIEWTVRQRTDPVPDGRYECVMAYSGPRRFEREERTLDDGSLWIGGVRSEPLHIEVFDGVETN